VDPSLFPEWNDQANRWIILRRNPRNPLLRPLPVKQVANPDGSYRPLDNRTLEWLKTSDLQRRFYGRRERDFGKLLDQAMRDEEAELDRERERKANDRWEEVADRAAFAYRRMERRGQI